MTMASDLSLIAKALEHGIARRQSISPSAFDECLRASIQTLARDDQLAVFMIEELGLQALESSRRGMLEDAIKLIRSARRNLAKVAKNTSGHLVSKSLLDARTAYYFFKRKRMREARRHLEKAYEVDLILEGQPNFDFFIAHRIQLIHNLIRVSIAQSEWEFAFLGAVAVLQYLECGYLEGMRELPRPWSDGWPENGCRNLHLGLKSALHGEIAFDLLQIDPRVELHPVIRNCMEIIERFTPSPPETQIGLWLVYCASAGSTVQDKLSIALPMLSYGPYPSSPLWRHVAKDLSRLLAEN
ncbi:hypothetical protein IE4803_PB00011 (plasmid) [Rhizobium etli bv. phaseoli str. IE4803]|nr:hypothetical protein IE4803_PB00011 [Rhizobium etli bv. phaseoli str. IE4803]